MRIHLSKLVLFGSAILFVLTFGGCCKSADSNPSPPSEVRGWQEFRHGPTKGIGEFVLKKGDSVSNYKVAVQLVETIKGKKCYGTESTGPGAVIRFFRPSDNQTIIEITVTAGNTRLINFSRPLVEEYGIDTISMRSINTKDGWVWFELWA